MAETTEEYRNRINQLKTSIENEPYIKEMRENIAEGISKTGNRQADIEVRQDKLEDDFVAVQQDASSASPSGAEVAVARAGFNTLDERLTTKEQEVTAQLAQTTTDLEERGYNIKKYGAVGDYDIATDIGTNSTQAINQLINEMPEYGELVLPAGVYYLDEPLIIDKYINVKASKMGGSEDGAVLVFDGCDGIIQKKPYIKFEGVSLHGINKPTKTVEDFHNGDIGTSGMLLEDGDGFTSSGTSTDIIRINGFNVGLTMRKGETGTWSGAYRDFYTPRIHYNDVGIYAVDGATHNKFYGGTISSNQYFGVFTKNDVYYTNLEFIGTTFESNGVSGGSFSGNEYEKYGIYCGEQSKIKLTNSYLEAMNVLADDGGSIIISSSHVHANTKLFSRGSGGIAGEGSFSTFKNVHKFGNGNNLLNEFSYVNCLGTSKGLQRSGINIESTESNKLVQSLSNYIFIGDLNVENLEWLKISLKVKVNSGSNAVGFGIRPVLLINDISGAQDVSNIDLVAPMEIYDFSKEEKIEFYYKPRIGGSYLNPDSKINFIRIRFDFFSDYKIVDYSNNTLNVDVYDPILEVHSTNDTNLLTVPI